MPISPSSIQGYSFGSEAERIIYNTAVQEGLFKTTDKYLFHSLAICKTGNKKIKAEVDFVYLDRDCILFLEVKGGQVNYDSNTNDWYVMGGTVKGDPFKQAYDALYQTRDHLLIDLFKNHSVKNRLVFGIGVLFPDCIKPSLFEKKQVSNLEYDPNLIYDFNDLSVSNNFSKYIERIKRYWSDHAQFLGRPGISTRELICIADFFRRDLHFRLPTSEMLKKSTSQVNHFTNMQMFALDMLSSNPSKGGLITGGPGTGKTVLALELLKRSVMSGKKTLFICFNKNLIEYLGAKISEFELGNNFHMRHLHGLLRDPKFIISNLEPVESSDDYWFQKLPLFFTRNLKPELIGAYDYLIIDEGQDIMNEYQIEALGKLVKGDLQGGQWAIFLDKEYQNIYNNQADEYFNYLREAHPTIMVPLQLNCRNTPSTVESASLQTGLPKMQCMRTEQDWKSIIKYYGSDKDLINMILVEVTRFEKDKIGSGSITILCTENKQISDLMYVMGNKLHEGVFPKQNQINILTVHSYKGLENEFIIILGPRLYDPENANQMKLIYIANTRACSQSIFFLDRRYKELLEENIY